MFSHVVNIWRCSLSLSSFSVSNVCIQRASLVLMIVDVLAALWFGKWWTWTAKVHTHTIYIHIYDRLWSTRKAIGSSRAWLDDRTAAGCWHSSNYCEELTNTQHNAHTTHIQHENKIKTYVRAMTWQVLRWWIKRVVNKCWDNELGG